MDIIQSLKNVYKANQCTDDGDLLTAIDQVKNLIIQAQMHNLSTRALYKRLLSLEKKYNSLKK